MITATDSPSRRQEVPMTDRADMYQQVTDRIVAALEAGTPPWVRPWTSSRGSSLAGWWPRNAVTGKPYNGVNVLLLATAGRVDPRWLTYNQARKLGGHVRKGEKATAIVFWKVLLKDERGDTVSEDRAAQLRAQGETVDRVFLLRSYSVFSVEQCDDLDLGDATGPELPAEERADLQAERCRAILQSLEADGCPVTHGGDRAFYVPGLDAIGLPHPEAFTDAGAYWATALHEATHATGHARRCDREFGGRFGDDAYAVEELVAELGSAFLCAAAAVDGATQHPAYLASWIRVLKADSRAVFTVAKSAQEAASWLLDRSGIGAEDEDQAEVA
jgi:antirestriction protein ArdC